MGSGSRFKINMARHGIGLGVYISNMPFAVTIDINVLIFNVSIGLGKPYDSI